MTKKQNKENSESLDEVLENVNLNEQTEMGEIASNMFKSGASRTNLSEDEVCLVFINDSIFK